MARLTYEGERWEPFEVHEVAIGVLDTTVQEFTARTGWPFEEYDEPGLGPMHYLGLWWDGRSRFLLSSSALYPDQGVTVQVRETEDMSQARLEFLDALSLGSEAWLLIFERGAWFVRHDQPHLVSITREQRTRAE